MLMCFVATIIWCHLTPKQKGHGVFVMYTSK